MNQYVQPLKMSYLNQHIKEEERLHFVYRECKGANQLNDRRTVDLIPCFRICQKKKKMVSHEMAQMAIVLFIS